MNPDGRNVNSLGLRGPEIPLKENEFRVLSMGESTTYAGRLPLEQSYSLRLQELVPEVDGRPVRVINAGNAGYTLFQGWVWLKEHGLALEPDAVLLYFGRNDSMPVSFLLWRGHGTEVAQAAPNDWELYRARMRPTARASHWLFTRSNLYRTLVHAMRPEVIARPEDLPPEAEERPRVPDQDRRKLLRRILDLCRRHGVRLTVIVPWYRDFDRHAPLLRRFCERERVPLVDLPRAFEELEPEKRSYFLDKVHPNAEGHARIAEEIARVVADAWTEAPRPRRRGD